MTKATNSKMVTENVQAIKCVWSGGGCAVWLLELNGIRFYRVSVKTKWIGDYATERDATDAMIAFS